jgi:hypothetical protein
VLRTAVVLDLLCEAVLGFRLLSGSRWAGEAVQWHCHPALVRCMEKLRAAGRFSAFVALGGRLVEVLALSCEFSAD